MRTHHRLTIIALIIALGSGNCRSNPSQKDGIDWIKKAALIAVPAAFLIGGATWIYFRSKQTNTPNKETETIEETRARLTKEREQREMTCFGRLKTPNKETLAAFERELNNFPSDDALLLYGGDTFKNIKQTNMGFYLNLLDICVKLGINALPSSHPTTNNYQKTLIENIAGFINKHKIDNSKSFRDKFYETCTKTYSKSMDTDYAEALVSITTNDIPFSKKPDDYYEEMNQDAKNFKAFLKSQKHPVFGVNIHEPKEMSQTYNGLTINSGLACGHLLLCKANSYAVNWKFFEDTINRNEKAITKTLNQTNTFPLNSNEYHKDRMKAHLYEYGKSSVSNIENIKKRFKRQNPI
ncbi:MAG: hypothetical protein OXE99_10505 [Cellvibrionales bacterium]|nr:hypothetical protein [Cellvibrionales bacterium]